MLPTPADDHEDEQAITLANGGIDPTATPAGVIGVATASPQTHNTRVFSPPAATGGGAGGTAVSGYNEYLGSRVPRGPSAATVV